MKKVLIIKAVVVLLSVGCSNSEDSNDPFAPTGGGGVMAGTTAGAAAGSIASGTSGAIAGAAAGSIAGGTTGAIADSGAGSSTDPCPGGVSTGSLVIDTAAKLEELANCTTLNDVIISGDEITSLNALGNVTMVTGYLLITDTKLLDLQGLDNLTSVGGDLYIGAELSVNTVPTPLTSLNGLANLQTIGGAFSLVDNGSLNDISALGNLTSIGGGKILQIRNSHLLPTCVTHDLAKQLNLDPKDVARVSICGTIDDECGYERCIIIT